MDKEKLSNYQPLWQLTILSLATFGLYNFYWFYRNWKHFKEYHNLDIRPSLRALGLFVPVFGVYLAYTQFKLIYKYARVASISSGFTPGSVWVAYHISNGFWAASEPYNLLYLLKVIPLLIVQQALNSYWTEQQPELEMKKSFIWKEVTILAVGILLWVILLLGIFLK